MSPHTSDNSTGKEPKNASWAEALVKTWSGLLAGDKSMQSGLTGLGWLAVPLIGVVLSVLLPTISIAVLGVTGTGSNWQHLLANVLPRAVADTLLLSLGVAAITLSVGCVTAWLVTMHEFPGRHVFARLLVMPLAIPTYIVAYCYVEVLDYTGPIQSALRTLTGWTSSRDYWFPDVRSMGGAVLVLSAVLYPYVYLSARASFVQQSGRALEVARTLGHTEQAYSGRLRSRWPVPPSWPASPSP